MIGRKAALKLSEVYHYVFSSYRHVSDRTGYHLNDDRLHDFLYERDYEAWFLNLVDALPTYNPRSLREFMMKLHTGESIVKATPEHTWEGRATLGQQLLRKLAQDIIVWHSDKEIGVYEKKTADVTLPQLVKLLELDGYVYRSGKLYLSESNVMDEEQEQGLLEHLVEELQLGSVGILRHHLALSETDYLDSKWDDSIINSRKFLELVLEQIAEKHSLATTKQHLTDRTLGKPVEIRKYLQNSNLLSEDEVAAVAKVYGLLSETGGHPYIAAQDQARLARNLALTLAQFALLRFKGFGTANP